MVKAADMECVKAAGRAVREQFKPYHDTMDKARVYDRLIADKADHVVKFKHERGGGWWFLDEGDTWAPANIGFLEDEVIDSMIAADKLYEVPVQKKAPKAKPGSDRPSTGDAW